MDNRKVPLIGLIIVFFAAVISLFIWNSRANSQVPNNSATPSVSVPGAIYNLLPVKDFHDQYEQDTDGVLLDVRTLDEFMAGHISAARNIDFRAANFTEEIKKLDRNRAYYVYCHSGNRSAQATKQMRELGFVKIYELQGGITAWQEANYPIVKTLPD